MKSIDDICEVYDVEVVNKDYINNFYNSFDALYDLNDYIKKNMGVDRIKLIPYIYIPFDKTAGLLVAIPSNKSKDIKTEEDELYNCSRYFFGKYEVYKTKYIFIDIKDY
ncbi:MAG: hypothetical protein IJ193_00915 [Bacilli bacterium]|nr:hypothetical protein [Bacilli bacterium]